MVLVLLPISLNGDHVVLFFKYQDVMTFNSMTVHTKFHENLTNNIYYNLSLEITHCDTRTGLKIASLYPLHTSQ
jgi:hypothetical protein